MDIDLLLQRQRNLAAGMDDYVTKLIRVDSLVEALNQIPRGSDSSIRHYRYTVHISHY